MKWKHYLFPVAALLIAMIVTGVTSGCGEEGDAPQETPKSEDTSSEHQSGHGSEEHSEQAHDGESSQELSGSSKDGVRVVEMAARQFEFDPDEVVIEKGEKVRLQVTSEEVTHGIELEGFDINRELPPDETVDITFVPEETGTFHFHCSVYCGSGHSDMHGELTVVENNHSE